MPMRMAVATAPTTITSIANALTPNDSPSSERSPKPIVVTAVTLV